MSAPVEPRGALIGALPQSRGEQAWTLIERYVVRYPDDWRMVFRSGETRLEVSVPEDVWRAFDGIQL